jgi:hypothetical protein
LYRNLGNGKWERHASEAPDQLFGESMVMGDFDGDGRTDLAVAYTSFELDTWRSGVDLLLSPPGGYWERHPLFAAATRKGPVALATGDLEGNGHKDLSRSPRPARP